MKFIAIFVSLFLFFGQVVAQRMLPSDLLKDVQNGMKVMEVPGLAISIVTSDSILLQKGFGVRSIEEEETVNQESLFGVGAITQTFTAMAVSILVQQGKLSWGSKVKEIIPYFDLYDVFASNEITVRDLVLNHIGLPESCGGTLWYGTSFSRREIVEKISHFKPVSSFRTKYAYHALSYLVVGEVIKEVSGVTWKDFIRKEIFNKIGMSRSSGCYYDLVASGNRGNPHIDKDKKIQKIKFRNYDNVGAALAINLNASDVSKYMQCLLSKGKINGIQKIPERVIDEVFTPLIIMPDKIEKYGLYYNKTNFNTLGLGWFIKDYCGRKLIYNTGKVDGMYSKITLIPQENIGICVMTNQQSELAEVIVNCLVDYYCGQERVDYLSMYEAKRDEEEEHRINTWKAHVKKRKSRTEQSLGLNDYVGDYSDDKYGGLKISLEEEKLNVVFLRTKSFKAQLEHWHFDTFLLNWEDPVMPKGFITFVLNEDGIVEGFKLSQPKLPEVDFSEFEFKKIKK